MCESSTRALLKYGLVLFRKEALFQELRDNYLLWMQPNYSFNGRSCQNSCNCQRRVMQKDIIDSESVGSESEISIEGNSVQNSFN